MFIEQPLLGHEYFKVNDECLYLKRWLESNILYVKDLVNIDGSLHKHPGMYKRLRETFFQSVLVVLVLLHRDQVAVSCTFTLQKGLLRPQGQIKSY